MDSKQQIAQELDELGSMYSQLEALQKQMQDAITDAMTDEVKKKVKAIQLEYGNQMHSVMLKVSALEGSIEAQTLRLEESVSGEKYNYRAVFQPGRYSWDGKALMEFAKTNYQILKMRKQGNPAVRIQHPK